MDVPRAQRREYNDLYRAHQATTTQDALKMEMMLSMLAQNNPAPTHNHNQFAQQSAQIQPAARHRENYGNARHGQRMPKVVNNPMLNGQPLGISSGGPGSLTGSGSSSHGGGMGQGQHAAADIFARPAESIHAPYPKTAAVAPNNAVHQNVDGFRYQSPRLQQVQPAAAAKFFSKLDAEFAERRRNALAHTPGWCAAQILQSPVDAWGLQAILLQIRGATNAGPVSAGPQLSATEQSELAPWNDRRPSPNKNVSFSAAIAPPTSMNGPNSNKPNRLSVPSATSDDSAPYDYFDEPVVDAGEQIEPPLTPTTSAYSEAPTAQNVPVPCIVRISGAEVYNVAGANHLVRLIAALIQESPRVLHAAISRAEPLSSGAHLGSFVPSPFDVSVKLLFIGRGPGDEFAYASDIFQSLGGCILVKAVSDYDLDQHDEVVVDNITRRVAPQRRI